MAKNTKQITVKNRKNQELSLQITVKHIPQIGKFTRPIKDKKYITSKKGFCSTNHSTQTSENSHSGYLLHLDWLFF